MKFSFYGCKKIDEIHFGCIPSNIQSSDNPFYVCDAYKYLPSGVTTIPTEWQTYTNFVLPFTSMSLDGNMSYSSTYPIELPTISTNPSYCGATEIVCQISNDDFATSTTIDANAILKGNYAGYKFRIAAKNELMNSYVYSNIVNVVASPYQATAYVDGKATRYKINQIYISTFADADSLVLEGAWTNSNFSTLRGALKEGENYYTSTNNKLIKIDMSNVTLSGDMALGVSDLFCLCKNLTEVILPEQESAVEFSLYGTFSGCSKLETIENLDKIKNITDLRETFKDCIGLKSLEFSASTNSNSIALYNTFYNCRSLESITNFEKFTNLYDFSYAFYGCSALKQIAFGTNPNTDNAKKKCVSNSNNAFSYTFTNCNANKSLPNGVSTIPASWQSFNNFILPFTSASLSGIAGFNTGDVFVLPTINPSPTYCAITNIVYELSNDDFTTKETYTPNTIVTKDYTGYKMRAGAKNASMNSYVYSSPINVSMVDYKLTAYTGGVASKYSIEQLSIGTLAQADSVVLYGKWNNDYVEAFAKSLKTVWYAPSTSSYNGNSETNSNLKKVDMSELTNTDTIQSLCLFHNCEELETVILPKQQIGLWGIGLYGAFNGCTKLKNVINLDKIKSWSVQGAFRNCTSLESVSFCEEPISYGKYSLKEVFYGCTNLKEVKHFDSFVNCTNASSTFYNCSSLKEIHLGIDPNVVNKNYDISNTFYNCNAIKYLPDTITTIPGSWQYYTNFVLPITSIELSGTATIDKQGGKIAAPTITCTPKYCIATDTVYLVSNNNFTTSKSFAPGDVIPSTYIGYQVKVGVKNARMDDYVYSPTLMTINTASTVIAYTGGKVTSYSIADLTAGAIASADSIIVEGFLDDGNLVKMRTALKTDGSYSTYNHFLKNVDMADATFIGDITSGLKYMFCRCDSLKNVILPSSVFTGKISVDETFYYCKTLEGIKNLDKLQNITSLEETFYYCSKLANIKFSNTENPNATYFNMTFYCCYSLESVDLSSFKNINGLSNCFYNCSSLKTVKFADSENNSSINLNDTFYGCKLLEQVDLSSFKNLKERIYRCFCDCSSLKTVKFADSENNNSIYLYYTFTDDIKKWLNN